VELVDENSLTTDDINPSTSASVNISKSESLLAGMQREADTVIENQRTSKEFGMFTKQQRRLLRQSTSTNLFGAIQFL